LAKLSACLGLLVAAVIVPAAAYPAALQFLEDEGEGDFDLRGVLAVTDAAKLSAQIAFNVQEGGKQQYLLTLQQGAAGITRVSGRQAVAVGPRVPLPLKSGTKAPFTLQRRDWRMALVWDGVVVLRAYDATLHDGKIGTLAKGGAFSDLRVQPVGEMIAQDDFVREEGAQSIWQPILGNWEARTLRDDPQAGREESDKSANAFSYFGSGSPRAVTIAGNWFWDRYGVETSVKPMGLGAVGVVLYYQDDKNYLVARWTSLADTGANGDKLQLVAMRNGQERVLAERSGGYDPGQWTKLRAQACDGIVQCVVDDQLMLETETELFGQGQMGLYVEGKAGAFFDDVSCDQWDLFRETFGKPTAGKWRGQGWVQQNGLMTHNASGRGVCTTGANWERYTVVAEVTISPAAGAGVAIAKTEEGYCVLRAAPPGAKAPYAGKAQLVRFTPKGGSVLAEQPLTGRAVKHTMRVSIADGLLTGVVDSSVRLQALAPGVVGGAIGLYADGRASFDNVRLSLLPPRKGSHVTKEFTESDKHPEMAEWASTKAPWVKPPEGRDDWWSKGDYFGETSIALTIPAVGSKTGTARVMLGSEPGQKGGVSLLITATEKSQKLALTLSAADQELKKTEVDVEGDANVVFSRESKLFVVSVNDRPVLTVNR